MSDENEPTAERPFSELEPIKHTTVAPAHGIAAVALQLALKYHDINTVQDGALYQQYKLEGRNIRALHLDMVFETAIKIERHLLTASDRIAKIVVDAIGEAIEEEEMPPEPDQPEEPNGPEETN